MMGMFGRGFADKIGLAGDILTGNPVTQNRMAAQQEAALRQQQANRPIVRDTGDGGYVVIDPNTGQVIGQQAGAPHKTALQQNYEYLKASNPTLAEQYIQNQADPFMGVQTTGPDGTPGMSFYRRGQVGQGQQPQMPAIGTELPDPRKQGGAPVMPSRTFP